MTKEKLGIPQEDFYIPQEVLDYTKTIIDFGQESEDKWELRFDAYNTENEELAIELNNSINNELPDFDIPNFEPGTKPATRGASGKVLEYLAENVPMLIGGSADLSPSNKTKASSQEPYNKKNKAGKYIHYGIREFGMGAIMNGIALHGGLVPYAGTFFVFSDYARPAMRMAALMGLQVIYVYTHDSIGLGEDGPTHQPIEHLASLRAMPNLVNLRPMDANETAVAWRIALERKNGPSTLVLTRQGLPVVDRDGDTFAYCSEAEKGAYVLTEDANYDTILMASGSEVEIILKAKELLNIKGIKVRVVSVLSTELFDEQNDDYKNSVLPADKTKRVALEAASSQSWYKYVGLEGKIIGLDHFGASAPFETLYDKFGITAEKVVDAVEGL